MFNSLFTQPSVLARHINAPYREERERYLRHCEQQGYTHQTLLLTARELLWIAQKLPVCPDDGVTIEQILAAANDWKDREHSYGRKLNLRWTRIRFIQVARTWLRFLGYWREPDHPVPFMPLLEAYRTWMQDERGFTTATIQRSCGYLQQFLRWYGSQHDQFSPVCINDVDTFLSQFGARGNCRQSVKNMAMVLRTFFKYAGTQGWCQPEVAPNIHGPRIFSQENLPYGPSWPEVTRLITSMETNLACDIRDKAITMLFAIYGFRCTEVSTLRLEDIDWEQTRGGLYQVVCHRMKVLGIQAPHFGPHSLRHACATHLIVEGLSLKEIGDHLGHRCSSATRIYAKVDLPALREVAKFDIGGLL